MSQFMPMPCSTCPGHRIFSLTFCQSTTRSPMDSPTLQLFPQNISGRSLQRKSSVGNISGDVGLVSAGRINKDTPPLTTPGHTSKSSAMDISSHMFKLKSTGSPRDASVQGTTPALYDSRPKPICMLVKCTRVNITTFWHGF